jgi:hypothetical protein
MFTKKAEAYWSGAPLKNSTLILLYWTYPQTFIEAGKAYRGQTVAYYKYT